MADKPVSYFSDGIDFSLDKQDEVSSWLLKTVENEGFKCDELTFIFTSDENLLKINRKYLAHDTYTDIITFDYCTDDSISGEIYISIDRIKENAGAYANTLADELHRVIVHGVLHLCGYSDQSAEEKSEMTHKEDYYLSLRTF